MKVIIRKGSPKSNEPRIFKCGYCSTIFETDEYRLDHVDYYDGTFVVTEITECPVCNKKRVYAYEV